MRLRGNKLDYASSFRRPHILHALITRAQIIVIRNALPSSRQPNSCESLASALLMISHDGRCLLSKLTLSSGQEQFTKILADYAVDVAVPVLCCAHDHYAQIFSYFCRALMQ